jgi:PAS domain S-box-containing protein
MILVQGTRATGAAAGILVELLENGQEIRTVAALGYPAGAVRTEPVRLSGSTPLSDCIVSNQAVWISSLEEFALRYPELAKLRGSFGNEATVALPLVVGDRVLGGLAFSFVEPRAFEADECEFFLAVAERCAQALERARSEEALRESEQRLRAILSQATAGIVRKDVDGTLLFVNEAFSSMLGYTSEELVGRTCWDVTHQEDVEENKRLFERLMEYGIPFQLERRLIRRDGSILWSNMSVAPILDASGKALSAVGVEVDITARKRAEDALYQLNVELERRVEERTEELQATNQALQESRQRLQDLSKRLVEVQEEERRALARELHDRVGQSLAALNLNLTIISGQLAGEATEQVSMRLADSMELVAEVIALVRDVMSNLRPSILDDYGLEAALQTHLNEFQARYGIQARFEKPNAPIPHLETSIEMTLLRIAQEALTNIARHAQADLALLSLELDDNQVCLRIEDNGAGINSLQEANRPSSHGLKIMRERAEALGGQLRVVSTPGNGTTIEAMIPIPPDGQHVSSQAKPA